MEAKPVFPEQCHKKQWARKKVRYISDLTQGVQKYPFKLKGNKHDYASKCKNPQVSSVIMEYETGTSKCLNGLQAVKAINEELLKL